MHIDTHRYTYLYDTCIVGQPNRSEACVSVRARDCVCECASARVSEHITQRTITGHNGASRHDNLSWP